ncbi:Glucosidase II beta subunit, putative isoform 1 [Hibiscus syriacus]|uniref:Glucosidase II beta subunit, putative isoform 1 n=1 Tax=Hibiscus syriacus TaxID=106335 RepID=A0A6A2WQM1_HIBSY|nr:uncharacterized protein LOC120185271 isoform X1 [Hibiscus syriacus]KAE8663153.1 Glucosidase II beta subunit, putative isoform 1 [Hibiscus syriacus]
MANSNPRSNLRCPHCAGPLSKEIETSEWTVSPLVRNSFAMIGSAVGGTTSAFYGFNHVMPIVRKYVKGPMWVHFLVGAPPVIVLSSACAGLADLMKSCLIKLCLLGLTVATLRLSWCLDGKNPRVVLFRHLLNLLLHRTMLGSRLLSCLHLHRMIRCISLGPTLLCNYTIYI